MLYHFETTNELPGLKADFIKSDLNTALTFAEIARQTGDRDKSIRNRLNARRGYDAVLRYIDSASLTAFELENLTKKLAFLKEVLLGLGEAF